MLRKYYSATLLDHYFKDDVKRHGYNRSKQFNFLFKVAHHTWIKFLKSRRNCWIRKNEVTYDRYECTKSKWKFIFGKILLSKTYFSNFLQKSQADLNSGCVVHKTNALDHWGMMIYKKVDRYKQFHRIFKSPYCDVGS